MGNIFKRKYIILMAIGILSLVIGLLLLGKSSESNSIPDYVDKAIDISYEDIVTIIDYLPYIGENNNDIDQFYVYQNKKVSKDDVPTAILIENALRHSNKINECKKEDININGLCDFIIKTDSVNYYLKREYNLENVELDKVIYGSGLLKCTLVSDYYACSNSGGGSISNIYSSYFDLSNSYTTTYLRTENDGDNIAVYEAYINYRFNELNDSEIDNLDKYEFYLYKYSNSDELLIQDKLYGKDFYEFDNNNNSFSGKLFDYVKNKYTTYKHIYSVNKDGSYSWVSTEPVE